MIIKYVFDNDDFEYEVDDINEAMIDEFMSEFKVSKLAAREIIYELELEEDLQERYENSIEEHYKDEAYEQYITDKEYEKDPEGFYGVSRRYD